MKMTGKKVWLKGMRIQKRWEPGDAAGEMQEGCRRWDTKLDSTRSEFVPRESGFR